MKSYFTCLRCSNCNKVFSAKEVQSYCQSCNRTLLAEYDLDSARSHISPDLFAHREGTLWRYRELLPVYDDVAIVSLGEGWTPLVEVKRLSNEVGIKKLYIKEEGYNPTGSFKARGLSVAVSK